MCADVQDVRLGGERFERRASEEYVVHERFGHQMRNHVTECALRMNRDEQSPESGPRIAPGIP
jgi:hypothetical protein